MRGFRQELRGKAMALETKRAKQDPNPNMAQKSLSMQINNKD